jgi:hypothetical protein
MTEIILYERPLYNCCSALYFPAFEFYKNTHKPARAKRFSSRKLVEQAIAKNLFITAPRFVRRTDTNYFEERIHIDNETDREKYHWLCDYVQMRNWVVKDLVKKHTRDNVEAIRRYGTLSNRYRLSSPITKRKAFLKEYKFSIVFAPSKSFISKFSYIDIKNISNFIWDFYKAEQYPVNDQIFQCFCLEYYFDDKDILGAGTQLHFRSEVDAAMFLFSFQNNFPGQIEVFQ